MSAAPVSPLALLRFPEEVKKRDLERTRRRIAAEKQRKAERRRGTQARPPASRSGCSVVSGEVVDR
ncbi:hypothetical protein AB0K85_08065 [Streptomyces cellulosae]